MEELILRIKPLTPIWTGDESRKCERLRETGIVGSLRWWYEALIRGLGGSACDPTNTKCDGEDHCDVCDLFGCTGWTRKFILRVRTLDKKKAPFVIAKLPGSEKQHFLGYYDPSGETYQKNGGLIGEYELTFVVEKNRLNLIKLLLNLAMNWGLGAGVQKGFGIVHVEGNIQLSNVKLSLKFRAREMNYRLPLPRIDQFFFYRIPVRSDSITKIRKSIWNNCYRKTRDITPIGDIFPHLTYIPSAPWVRKSLRQLFRDNDVLRHYLMGFVSIEGNPKPIHLDCWQHSIKKDRRDGNKYYCENCRRGGISEKNILKKTGSKIFVSHIYNRNAFVNEKEAHWEMKIWGWVPNIPGKIGVKRDEVKRIIQESFENEEFWKNIFGLQGRDETPVIIEKIVGKWDVDPENFLRMGGRI